MTTAGETVAERVKMIRELVAKRTQAEFADTIGLGRASVANWERGGRVSGDNLLKICERHGINMAWLKDGIGPMLSGDDNRDGGENASIRRFGGGTAPKMDALPILATRDQGAGLMLLTQSVIGYSTRPAPLKWVDEAFGIYVSLIDMVPSFRVGDTAWINPRLPGVRDRDAIFSRKDDDGKEFGRLAILEDYNDEEWTVRTINPENTVNLPRSIWTTCHRVVARYDGI